MDRCRYAGTLGRIGSSSARRHPTRL